MPSLALGKPMLQEAIPWERKVRTLLPLLIGLGFAAILSSVLWIHHGGEPAIDMAVPHMQPLKASQFMQPMPFMPLARAWQPMQVLKAPQLMHQSLQQAKPWQFTQPVLPWQSMPLVQMKAEEGEGGAVAEAEKRIAEDGVAYTKEEFVDFYKGTAEWDAAKPAGEGEGEAQGGWEEGQGDSGGAGTGVLMRWMSDRGFGFIQPEGGGDELFAHVSSMVDGEGSVQEGNKVTYVSVYNDRKGTNEASEVRLAEGGEGDHRGVFAVEEKRPAPDGSGSYTKKEFEEFYSGTTEWDAAAPAGLGTGAPVTGVLMRWMSDRGFGFIKSVDKPKSEDLFCHVRAFVDGEGSIQEGNKVTYIPSFNDRKGKYECSEVRLAEEGDFRAEFTGPPADMPVPAGGTGVLMRWMTDRGFGFIKPEGDGEDLFCHVRSLVDGENSVQEGNKVTYVPAWNDRKQNYEASEVRLAPGGEGDHRWGEGGIGAVPDDGQERREAPDGSGLFTQQEFIDFYGGTTEWDAAPVPEEKRKAEDGQMYTKADFVEFYKGTAEWDAAAPPPKPAPAPAAAPVAAGGEEEKRKAEDGVMYTKAEFVEFYKGTKEWDAAAPATAPAPSPAPAPAPAAAGGEAEKRIAPDGVAYTKEEFVDFYKGTTEWDAAKPASAPAAPSPAPAPAPATAGGETEKRKAPDGVMYTKEEFVDFYKGTKEWDAAAPAQAAASPAPAPVAASGAAEKRAAPDGSGSYTKEEFIDFYGGTAEWDAAAAGAASPASAPVAASGAAETRAAPDGSGTYTKEEFIDFYGGTAEWDAAAAGAATPAAAPVAAGGAAETRAAPDGSGTYTKEEFIDFYGGTAEWDAAGGAAAGGGEDAAAAKRIQEAEAALAAEKEASAQRIKDAEAALEAAKAAR